jgi:ubiquinone/menaquinone biosynthesis C-methylase UbiE
MKKDSHGSVEVFNNDVLEHATYKYTDATRLSCRLNHKKIVSLVTQISSFSNKAVLDMGCGDGFFSELFWQATEPKSLVGIDLAENAVRRAEARQISSRARFEVGDVYKLDYPDNSFDVVFFNAILHHLDEPFRAISEGFRLASEIVIFEPNGNNPGLKLIEKVSPYHIEHQEKSYSSSCIQEMIRSAGGTVASEQFGGFVPYFWPDLVVRCMKSIEPVVESIPLVNSIACAYYAVAARRL